MSDIKPRVDDDGVPWVSVECPLNTSIRTAVSMCTCHIDKRARYVMDAGGMNATVCPHAVRRMALALKAFEDGFFTHNRQGVLMYMGEKFDTLEAAIDALELEE